MAIGEAADLARTADYDEFGVPFSDGPTADLLDEVARLGADDADAAPSFGYRREMHLDGMVHLRAREYAPGLGRFTTVDPLAGDALQWEANRKFLERAIQRGSDFRLATPAQPLERLTGYYAREIDYLLKKGYTISDDGLRLIPPRS